MLHFYTIEQKMPVAKYSCSGCGVAVVAGTTKCPSCGSGEIKLDMPTSL